MQGREPVCKTSIQDVAGEIAAGAAWTARHGGSCYEGVAFSA